MKDTNELRDIINNMKINENVSLEISNVLVDLIDHIDCLENKLNNLHNNYLHHNHGFNDMCE
jgi:hypothetical protein